MLCHRSRVMEVSEDDPAHMDKFKETFTTDMDKWTEKSILHGWGLQQYWTQCLKTSNVWAGLTELRRGIQSVPCSGGVGLQRKINQWQLSHLIRDHISSLCQSLHLKKMTVLRNVWNATRQSPLLAYRTVPCSGGPNMKGHRVRWPTLQADT